MSNPPPVKTPRLQDTLQLDRRARAMLKAMGIQWFWPSAPSSVAVAAPPAPAPLLRLRRCLSRPSTHP